MDWGHSCVPFSCLARSYSACHSHSFGFLVGFGAQSLQRSAPQTGIRATYRNVPNQEPLLDGRHRKRSGREIAGNDACRGSIGKSFATEFCLCRGLRWRSDLSTAGAGLMFWLLSTCTLQFVLSRPCASCWFALLPSPCQGSTSAAAREKLRYCEVYLAIHSDEAGAWLCPAFANGGATGPSKYIDLQLYLNVAHGGSFSFSTQIDRQKVIKQKVLDPKAPYLRPLVWHWKKRTFTLSSCNKNSSCPIGGRLWQPTNHYYIYIYIYNIIYI